MSWGPGSAVWALVLQAVGANMVRGLTLIALGDEREGVGVGNDNRLSPSARFHNHLQSSRESDMSRAGSWGFLVDDVAPSSLSWDGIPAILFPGGHSRGGMRGSRKEMGSPGYLWDSDVDTSGRIGSEGSGRRGFPDRPLGVWVDSQSWRGRRGCP